MFFSILVPVYNVEKYLKQCIESVLAQDFQDYELVLVNDGSTDKSPEICEEYAAKDSRIVYYSKENEGLLLTRRYGIRRARGEYVLFLDSDDYWEKGLLTKLASELHKKPVDLVIYRFCRVTDDGKKVYEDRGIFPDHTYFDKTNKEEFVACFVSTSRLNVMWCKCVKRSILDVDTDYSAFRDKKGEDLLQSIAIIKNAQNILYLDDPLYNYRLSPSGRGRNFKEKYISDYEDVRAYVELQLKNMHCNARIMDAFYIRYIDGYMLYIRSIVKISPNRKVFERFIGQICTYSTYQKASQFVIPKMLMSSEHRWNYRMIQSGRLRILYFKYWVINHLKNTTHGSNAIK